MSTETGIPDEHAADDGGAFMQGMTILLVEDDAIVCKIAVTLLSDLKCRILTADSGPVALEIFAKTPDIDLLFTDMNMPGGMTGIELAARMRERLPDLRVLYTSGYARQVVADSRAIEHPNDFWLSKPYNLKSLRNAVCQALSRKVVNPG